MVHDTAKPAVCMAIYPRGAGRCRGRGSGIFQHQAHKLKDVKTDVLETGSKMVTTIFR